jgi:hypothetical protein
MTQAMDDPLARHSMTPSELKAIVAAERTGPPFVTYRDANGQLVVTFLDPEKGRLILGRHAWCDLCIPWDQHISGVHAELVRLGPEWFIVDDGVSMNGTFCNGARVSGRLRLRDRDRIRVGQTIIAFVDASEHMPITAVHAMRDPPELTETQLKILRALARPLLAGSFAAPASNSDIAHQVMLSVDSVKANLRVMFARFELDNLPQNQKRAALAETAIRTGIVSKRLP